MTKRVHASRSVIRHKQMKARQHLKEVHNRKAQRKVMNQVKSLEQRYNKMNGSVFSDNQTFKRLKPQVENVLKIKNPDYQIMTNIDFDHPDYFKDQDDYTSAFQSAADQTKKALFVWGDDKRLQSLKTDIPKYTYGFNDTDDFQAVDIKKSSTGSKFHVLAHGKDVGEFEIHLFGDHSILNSTAVIAVAYTEKVPMDDIRDGLLTFKGAKRRFSEKDFGDIAVIDDYAHHPTEMRATIQAARQKFPDKKLVVVFQPHTFSRTKKYQKDFEEILRGVDKAYVTPIYASAREANGDISSEDLVKNIPGSEVIDLDNIADLTKNKNSVIVFMGAGDIPKYEDAFEKLL